MGKSRTATAKPKTYYTNGLVTIANPGTAYAVDNTLVVLSQLPSFQWRFKVISVDGLGALVEIRATRNLILNQLPGQTTFNLIAVTGVGVSGTINVVWKTARS